MGIVIIGWENFFLDSSESEDRLPYSSDFLLILVYAPPFQFAPLPCQ